MNKTRELKIDSILWTIPSKLVNLLDFNPDKISIKTENHAKRGGFYLTIDNLDGYFDLSHNLGHLNLLFDDDNKQNKYCQVWKEILKTINGGHGKIIKCKEIRLFDND